MPVVPTAKIAVLRRGSPEVAPPSRVLREHSDWGVRYSKNEEARATRAGE